MAYGQVNSNGNIGVELAATKGTAQDAHTATQILGWDNLQYQRQNDAYKAAVDAEILGELHEVTLTNTQRFPFNSSVDSPAAIALTTTRKNLFYTVETEVKEHTGLVGDIIVSDKALNGFKLAFTGNGSRVTLAVRVKGGMR